MPDCACIENLLHCFGTSMCNFSCWQYETHAMNHCIFCW